MVLQTLLKMVIDLTMHQETENYEHVMESHELEREDTAWCQAFACKQLFWEGLQLGYIGVDRKL